MSYLLEALGRGLVTHLTTIFQAHLPQVPGDDDLASLAARAAASPQSLDLAQRLGAAQLRAGRWAEARQAFEHAGRLDGSARVAHVGLACVADELGDARRALHHLHQAQALDAADPALAFAVGLLHERDRDAAGAKSSYRLAITRCPRLQNGYERLAAIALREGQYDEALACYEELGEIAHESIDTLLTLGGMYLVNRRPLDAIEQFQLALLVEPESDDEVSAAALESGDATRLPAAIRQLERTLEKYPDVASLHVRLGDLHARGGDDDAAVAAYRGALARNPNFLEATVKLGAHHLRQCRWVAAAQTFSAATELNDRLTLAFVGLALAQHAAGHCEEAEATFDLAASIEPSSTLLLAEASRLHFQAARNGALHEDRLGETEYAVDVATTTLDEVVQRHRRAVAGQRGSADLHYRFGVLLRHSGRGRDAQQAFARALDLNPQYAKALVRSGLCAREAGDRASAWRTLQRIFELEPAEVSQHYRVGLLFAQPSPFELAVESFEQLHDLDPPADFDLRSRLGLMLLNVGLLDRVAATWRSLCDVVSDPDEIVQRKRKGLTVGQSPA